MNSRTSVLSACAVLVFSASAGADDQMAVVVDSAVVEMREGPTSAEIAAETQVVILGTGTPIPDAYRAGPSIAVIHKGEAYLFDVGAGAVRNAIKARYKYDIPSLYPTSICCVFMTHVHSDHMLDYSELAYTMWWRRSSILRAWGPAGLKEITAGMQDMMAVDDRTRSSGSQPVLVDGGYRVDATEIEDGFVLEIDGLRIEAFLVNHGDIKPAFGYHVSTEDKTIVISGDTAVSEKLEEMAAGVDILFHEVISDSGLMRTSPSFQAYHKRSHTTATELASSHKESSPDYWCCITGCTTGCRKPRFWTRLNRPTMVKWCRLTISTGFSGWRIRLAFSHHLFLPG